MVENASRNCKSRPYGSRTAPTKNGARRSRPRFRVRLAARAVTGNRTPRDVNFSLATTGTCSRRNLGFAPCRWFNKARFATFPSLLFFSFPEKNTARESAREIRGICGGVNPFPYSSAPPDGQNSQVAGRYSQNNESAHQGAPRAHSRTRPAPGMGVGLKTPRFWWRVACCGLREAHTREGSNVVDCGHSYCFGRSRSGGPLRGFGTGLPNGRTEFPIGRSAVRTTTGKVRTTIKKRPLPNRESPRPNRAKVPFDGFFNPSIQAESA